MGVEGMSSSTPRQIDLNEYQLVRAIQLQVVYWKTPVESMALLAT